MNAEKEIDRLYELPLDEFTAARNELAKELRSAGDREEAGRVKGLKKPTVAAGALNHAVRRSPERLKEFLDAARELREAHGALMAGGERDAVDAASRRERAAATALVDEAGGSEGVRERVAATLRAAVADDEARAALEAGRLERELEAVGLGPFAAGPPAAGTRKAAGKRDRGQSARRELKEAKERERRAQRRLRDAGLSVASASERAEAAMETLDRARKEEAAAQADADEAAAAVEELE